MKKIALIIFCMISFFSFSKELVVTGNQATYTIANVLTKDTNIEIKDIFKTEQSMGSDQLNALKSLDLSEFKEAKAVIDLQRVWNDDALFEYIRRQNISVIEIDASYSYQDNSSLALLIDNYHNIPNENIPNPYVWLNLNNLKKMFKIVAHDLSKIFPKEKNKIENNLNGVLKEIDAITDSYNELDNISAAIVLSENLNYLTSFLNIYNYGVNYADINVKNVSKIIKDSGINLFLTEKPLKKDIVQEIEKNKAKVVVIKTGAFPEEDDENDEEMNKLGLLNIIKENLKNLKEVN